MHNLLFPVCCSRCWCASCEIVDNDMNKDRHRDSACKNLCAGDPTSTCGGCMAISFY